LKVVFDTSFIIYICQKPSSVMREMEDILGKVEIVVPSPVYNEVKRLAKRKKPAKVALEKLSKDAEIVEHEGPADKAIIDVARRLKAPIATTDLSLAAKLRREGLPYFTVKDDHLVTIGKPIL